MQWSAVTSRHEQDERAKMKVAFAGSFALHLAEPVRSKLSVPCHVVTGDEAGIAAEVADTDDLDVWYHYLTAVGAMTPSSQPFHELANVIMAPPISGWTGGMLDAGQGHCRRYRADRARCAAAERHCPRCLSAL